MGESLLTNSEWYVLDCLWDQPPRTVMQLVAALGERLGWAKSTTITTLRRMEDKGLVRAEVRGRTKILLSGGGAPAGRHSRDPELFR